MREDSDIILCFICQLSNNIILIVNYTIIKYMSKDLVILNYCILMSHNDFKLYFTLPYLRVAFS